METKIMNWQQSGSTKEDVGHGLGKEFLTEGIKY